MSLITVDYGYIGGGEPNSGTLTYIGDNLHGVTVDTHHDYLIVFLRRNGNDPALSFNGSRIEPNFKNAPATWRYWLWRIKDVESGNTIATSDYTTAEAYYIDFD